MLTRASLDTAVQMWVNTPQAASTWDPPFERTYPSARSVLTPEPGYDENNNGTRYRVAVVGNGPLREEDRPRIDAYRNIVRFNDAKNLRPGERTTVHVGPYDDMAVNRLRSPQATANASLWTITNRWQEVRAEDGFAVITLNYQSYEDDVPALDFGRFFTGRARRLPQTLGPWAEKAHVFTRCANCTGNRCLLADGWLGMSAGGAVIEALDALDPPLEEIAVFGMNWLGRSGHTDFRDPTLVRDCCARCVIHPTASDSYLPQGYLCAEGLREQAGTCEQQAQDLRVAFPAALVALLAVGALVRSRRRPPVGAAPTSLSKAGEGSETKENVALVREYARCGVGVHPALET